MLLKAPTLDVQQANVQTIDIGQVAIGPIVVDDLVLSNTDFSLLSAQGKLHNVSVTVSVAVSVEWHVHVGMPDWIPDIDIGDTYNLGSLSFGPVNIGDVVIPALNNVHVHIPTLAAQNMSVAATPANLQLHNATADQIHATNLALPSAGFTVAGLALGSVQGSGIGVPAASIDQATVGHVHGDALQIPSFTLNNLNLPAVQIPNVSSAAPLDIPATLPTRAIGFDAGLLRVYIYLTPSAQSHVGQLEITNASASAKVGQIVLHNVTLPYDVLNLTLSHVGINSVSIPLFDLS